MHLNAGIIQKGKIENIEEESKYWKKWKKKKKEGSKSWASMEEQVRGGELGHSTWEGRNDHL